MAYTETTTTTYGQRLKKSGKGILSGILMFIIGTGLLWWNEGRTVKQTRALNQTEKACVELDVASVDPAFEGKTVHATAVATTDNILSDKFCGASANAIAISRDVEYYQWVEHSQSTTKDKIGGGQETVTTYTYQREWVSSPVNSANFHDPDYKGRNSVRIEVSAGREYASDVKFGAYRLSQSMISSFPCDQPMDLSGVNPSAGGTVSGNTIYYGNASQQEIGDVRVTFRKAPASAEASIVADVTGDTFTDHIARNGKHVQLISMGARTSEQMFETAHRSNKAICWILRIVGILLVVFGLQGLVGIVIAILKVLPFLANIVNVGTNLICWVAGLAWSFIIIAIAWIAYRPFIAVMMLAAVGCLVWFLIKRSREASEPAEPRQ